MGEQRVSLMDDQEQMQRFVKLLLKDVQALEYMLDNDWFESDIVRIGAEQEMVMVNNDDFKPACIAAEVLPELEKKYDWVESELARFNLETNLTPRVFTGNCLREMEAENRSNLTIIQKELQKNNASLLLTGILPTLRKTDMGLHNLTPKERYKALMEALTRQHLGSSFELRLVGIDELQVKHDTPFIEAVNTSFQVHLQVAPKEFVKMYNIAQTLAGPCMAIAANSPIVFGKRLWHETRIAIFQQALDTRSSHDHMRERSPRVSFGKAWLEDSILEIYKEDIARFRVLLSSDIEEDSLEKISKNEVPKLKALQVHNSTIYRWNRPCFGISDNGKPHLRIENRVLAAGPTIEDEMANACFWLGCMMGMALEVEDVRDLIGFHDVRDNFSKAAKFGIDSKFNWFGDIKISACELIQTKLIPMARKGLKAYKIEEADIERYLGIIQARADSHMNGARWALRAYTKLLEETTVDEAVTVLTAAILKNQSKEFNPVHLWPMPELKDLKEYLPSKLQVGEFMVTDIFTVQKDDIIDLVAELMDWRKIRYTPVEDAKGTLIGLVTSRLLLRHLVRNRREAEPKEVIVEQIMIKDPVTVTQETSITEAMQLMRENMIGCLPVVKGKELIGIITEKDFLQISGRLIERL
jgi:CBS domain-containing protein/gamma-glutamylcysteine synthetase